MLDLHQTLLVPAIQVEDYNFQSFLECYLEYQHNKFHQNFDKISVSSKTSSLIKFQKGKTSVINQTCSYKLLHQKLHHIFENRLILHYFTTFHPQKLHLSHRIFFLERFHELFSRCRFSLSGSCNSRPHSLHFVWFFLFLLE